MEELKYRLSLANACVEQAVEKALELFKQNQLSTSDLEMILKLSDISRHASHTINSRDLPD